MDTRKGMCSYACGVTSSALVKLHALPRDQAVWRLHALWGATLCSRSVLRIGGKNKPHISTGEVSNICITYRLHAYRQIYNSSIIARC